MCGGAGCGDICFSFFFGGGVVGGSEEEDHGRTGKRGAPAAPSVPVPRPVARGLADRRPVRMLACGLRTARAESAAHPHAARASYHLLYKVHISPFVFWVLVDSAALMCWEYFYNQGCCDGSNRCNCYLVCAETTVAPAVDSKLSHSKRKRKNTLRRMRD